MGELFSKEHWNNETEGIAHEAVWMGAKIQFSSLEYAKTFNTLSVEAKNRIAAFVLANGDFCKAADCIGVSKLQFPKRLAEIFKNSFGVSRSHVLVMGSLPKQSSGLAEALMGKIKAQNYRCALSGVKLIPSKAEVDHIVPLSKGGSNSIDNLQWVHKVINRMKGNMSQDDFIRLCSKVATWTR
jgi:hypothetical protein